LSIGNCSTLAAPVFTPTLTLALFVPVPVGVVEENAEFVLDAV
jgi:hypothetical protein